MALCQLNEFHFALQNISLILLKYFTNIGVHPTLQKFNQLHFIKERKNFLITHTCFFPIIFDVFFTINLK
jgi:hypothetical protein